MVLEGAKININFMLGASKMGPGGENKVCQANYFHFCEENGGPQKYARRTKNVRHHRWKRDTAATRPQHSRNTAAGSQFSAPGCPWGRRLDHDL